MAAKPRDRPVVDNGLHSHVQPFLEAAAHEKKSEESKNAPTEEQIGLA